MMQARFALAMLEQLSLLRDGFLVAEIMVALLLSTSAMEPVPYKLSSVMRRSLVRFVLNGVFKSRVPFDYARQEMKTATSLPVKLKSLPMM
jgi:hypothetical protein